MEMPIPPDTHCAKCSRLLLSAKRNADGNIALTVGGDMALTKTVSGELLAACPGCGHPNAATTLNQLLASGWDAPMR